MKSEKIIYFYLRTKDDLIKHGYGYEIDWQETRDFQNLTESEFIKESAWVILNSGMKEEIIRNKFQAISGAFLNWQSATIINDNFKKCYIKALKVFNHKKKIISILKLCEQITVLGFNKIYENIRLYGLKFLMTLDYIGPVTCYHLAKNIGLDVVKPDRHLKRIADLVNCTPDELCTLISKKTGDKKSVVDLILWRFASINKDYQLLIPKIKLCPFP